jgi:general stress protein 26
MEAMTAERLLAVTRATIEAAEYCFLITRGAAGQANARLMMPFPAEEDLTIWMGASPGSRKVRELQADDRTTLGYPLAQDGAYVTLLGTASIERDLDLRKQYWRRRFVQFWPEGPESDDYALIKFLPSRIELMNVALEVAPDPDGLRFAVLVRDGAAWAVGG